MLPVTSPLASPLDALTPAQLACVRMIRTKGSNKRIAAELGISPNTVSQHLKEARIRLGNVSRFDAAEIVAACDAYPQESTSGSQTLVRDAEWAMLIPPSPSVEAPTPTRVQEEILSFRPGEDPASLGLARLTGYWLKRIVDELTGPDRLRGAVMLALVITVTTLLLIALANVVQVTVATYVNHA